MHRTRPVARLALCCLALLLATSSTTHAQDNAERLRVARLIRDLGNPAYQVRHDASEELNRLGKQTLEQLQTALDDDDPEIRLRARHLVDKLKVAAIWEPSRVQCESLQADASDVLRLVAEQTGNRVLVGDPYGKFRDQPVAFHYEAGPFWQVMDDICRQTGNRVRPHYDTRHPGLVVVAGTPGKFPVAYAGPIRAEVTSARRVFIEELDYEQGASEITHTFQLNLQLMWEDRFRLVAYRSQPELVEAITATGDHLAATQPAANAWNVAGNGSRQVALNLRLHPPTVNAQSLERLAITWGLIAVGDMQTIEIDDLESTAPHLHENVEVRLESVEKKQGARYEVTLLVNRDLVVPEPQEIVFLENDVELIDDQGRPFRTQGQTNSLTSEGARMKITFTGESSDSEPARLVLRYPRVRSHQDLEIVFDHVPLPTGRPD